MLIEFSVGNFRSIRDLQTLSMVRGQGKELSQNSFIWKGASKSSKLNLLKTSAIYGPNAGGKSNLLNALSAMKRIVLDSASKLQEGDSLPVVPFRLDSQKIREPSEFEVVFVADGIRYQYGFSATSSRIIEEWLFAYPKGYSQKWFSREWSPEKEKYEWSLGPRLQGEKQLWQKATRSNALFLSTAVQLNSEQLRPVYNWFLNILKMANVGGWAPTVTASRCQEDENKSEIIKFLKAADLNIQDIEVKEEMFDSETLPTSMPDSLKELIIGEMENKKVLELKTIHQSLDGDSVWFDMDDESDGTQRLFSFAGPWVEALKNGYVLFIDELHAHLHPRLVRYLVDLFHNEKTNPANAQLVFTTHETSILNQKVFRRDQIWFCNRGREQATYLYPLSDFNPRKDRENLELSYLEGKYGAVPFVGSIEDFT